MMVQSASVELESIAGLPAHPLVVHAAVVLVPLAALGLIVVTVWPAARARYGWLVLGVTVVATGFVFLATGSGEALEERVERNELVRDHAELGDAMQGFAVALLLGAAAVMVLDWWLGRQAAPATSSEDATALPGWVRPARIAVAVFAVVAAALALWWIWRVGHSGAKATWDDLPAGD